jgi:hypothetical protein
MLVQGSDARTCGGGRQEYASPAPYIPYYAHRTFSLEIPQPAYIVTKPVFFGACTLDAPCPPVLGDMALKALVKGPVTRHEYETGHWVLLTHYEALGKDLLEWLAGLPSEV